MSTPFVGEIRMFGFSRVPSGWQACDGSLLAISEYEVLYMLLGTTYGGDGQSTFAVPDLRGRLPMHQGTGPGLSTRVIGQVGGSETVALTTQQMASHSHPVLGTSNAASIGNATPRVVPGAVSGETAYASDLTGSASFTLAPNVMTSIGGNLSHDNTMPTLTAQICISTVGIFPSQS